MPSALFRRWLPVVVWAAVIFGFSSIATLSSGLGGWDLLLRKTAHLIEFGILGALLLRATRTPLVAILLGVLYAVSDELHQHYVPGRRGAPLDVAIDAFGVLAGVLLLRRLAGRVST